jgi:hypothetical protein
VVEQMPRMEANTGPATRFQQATAADFAPVAFHGDRTPNDPTPLLESLGLPLVKMTSIHQRALDLHAQIPTHEQLQEVRLEVTSLKNRLADLKRPMSEGGSPVPATAWQVADVERKLERAERELARLTALKEVRTVKWNAAGQLHRFVSDWLLHGGIPHGCTIDSVEDAPVGELLTKVDGGRIEAAVERYRLRQRECAAERHA